MKRWKKGMYRIMTGFIIFSLNLQPIACCANAAEVVPDPGAADKPAVVEQNGVPVVNIVTPNDKGLSHNKYTEFNVGPNGLILNNNATAGAVQTQLAGMVGTNANVAGHPAGLILNEVTGSNLSRLNGKIEIAGQAADVVIANPNGIVGNGFGFINTNRASLVTGTPNIVDGSLDSFTVKGGEVWIEGAGNTPPYDAETGEVLTAPVSKLDIMTRAAHINAELWAKDEINVITGANTVKYATLAAVPDENPPDGSRPSVALDIAALGGMYAGKVKLVGTEKGLGYNIQGNIYANHNLFITNEGKITFKQSERDEVDDEGNPTTDTTTIVSDGDITVKTAGAVDNQGQIFARTNVAVTAAKDVNNTGVIQAGTPYEVDENDPDSEEIRETANLTVQSGGQVVNHGVIDASGDVSLTGQTVTYNPMSVTGAHVNIIQTNPPAPDPDPGPGNSQPDPDPGTNPGTEPQPEKDTETTTSTIRPGTPDTPQLPAVADTSAPAAVAHVEKDKNVPLTADLNADMKYQPIIDKAANGVDLVQIAEADKNGVSRNLYTDFNIKDTGLILNNATEYTRTELGGYIDRNSRLAGHGAGVILNEVTSSHPSSLNGFLEVAGQRASVVLANANGIKVNGFGYINTSRAVLSTAGVSQWENGAIEFGTPAGDFLIQGDGLNAKTTDQLDLITRDFMADRSELWANHLHISADGTLNNTGNVSAAKTMSLNGDRLQNTGNGYMEAGEDLSINVKKDVAQDTATIKAGGTIDVTAENLENKNNSAIQSGGDVHLLLDKDVNNTKSIFSSGRDLTVKADNLSNTDTSLISYGGDGNFTVSNRVANKNAAIQGQGKGTITAAALENTEQAVVTTGGDLTVAAADIHNDHATMYSGANGRMTANALANTGNGYIYGDQNITIDVKNSLHNQKATLKAGKTADIAAAAFANEDGGYLASGQDMTLTAGVIANDNAAIHSGGVLTVTGASLHNQNNAWIDSQNDGSYDISDDILNSQAALTSSGSLSLTVDTLTNDAKALLAGGKNVDIAVNGSIANTGAAITGNDSITIQAADLANTANSVISAQKDATMKITGRLHNDASTIETKDNMTMTADRLENNASAAITAGGNAKVHIAGDLIQDHSILTAGGDASVEGRSLTNTNNASLAADGNLNVRADGDILNDHSSFGAGKAAAITAENITNRNQGEVFVTGAMDVKAGNAFVNADSLVAGGDEASVRAKNIKNTGTSILYAGKDLTLSAQETLLNQSSDIESQGNIHIQAGSLVNEKEIFETGWTVTDQNISYKIQPLDGPRYYNAVRSFNRNIHAGTILKETADAHILADGNIDIQGSVTNHYSTIAAGQDLTITGDTIENYGYQGTNVIADRGNDTHYWKYKEHRHFPHHSHWKYGTTVIPYSYDEVQEQDTARLGLLSAGGTTSLNARTIDNKTFDAGQQVIDFTTKAVHADVQDQLAGKTIVHLAGKTADKIAPQVDSAGHSGLDTAALNINTKIFTLHQEPAAKYLIETNRKFADYQNFLFSDYLLNRIEADPEKVAKRLGDGYYEQKLVTEQLTELTGRRYLDGYNSDLEQYKALMENGAVAAKTMNLSVGVALTPEQTAALTADIVWLVEETVNGQKVLVPEVYLASLKEDDITPEGAVITGNDVELYAKQDLTNIGTIKAGNSVQAKAADLVNQHGTIEGGSIDLTADHTLQNLSGTIRGEQDVSLRAGDIINKTETKETQYRELHQITAGDTASITAGSGSLSLEAEHDITNEGAWLQAGKTVTLQAKNDLTITAVAEEKHVAVTYAKSSAALDEVLHRQSMVSGSDVSLSAGHDVNLEGALVSARENAEISAGHDVNLTAVKDNEASDVTVGRRGGHYFRHDKTVDETVVGTQIGGSGAITVTAGNDVNVTGSGVNSESGAAKLNAGDNITIRGETEHHENLQEEHREKKGAFSSKKIDTYDSQTVDAVVGSAISGGTVDLKSGKDVQVAGSHVVADRDVTVSAGGDIQITAQEEISTSDHRKQVKKSGLLSGGGFGITIGKEKRKDTYAQQNTEQIGSTIGSTGGSVTMESGKDIRIEASDVLAGQDIRLTGGNVAITTKDNHYEAQEQHEYKKSGLTVSLGGGTVDAFSEVAAPVRRATQVEDDRLKALYGYKAAQEIREHGQDLQKAAEGKLDLSLNVGFGASKSESKAQSSQTTAQASSVKAGGDVRIEATQHDIRITGSEVDGNNVTLQAKDNIDITAGEDTRTSSQSSTSSKGNIGVSLSTGTISARYDTDKENEAENGTTNRAATVTARDTVTVDSGQDTNIIGSKVQGDTVKVNTGGDLNLESLQDQESYRQKESSGSLKTGSGTKGSAGKGKIDSDYRSVTEQAGIYAGQGGFDIHVGENTDLKGAVIASDATPDKNKLSTGTLTFSDIENNAEYSASSSGVNYNAGKDVATKDLGLTPALGVKVSGDASSTTQSGIANGTIEIRNGNTDLSKLNRDTSNSLHALDKIFDKKTVQEKQEMSKLFGEVVFKAIGDLHLKEGSAEKVALDAFAGGVMAQLGGGSFASGAAGAGFNQIVINELAKIKDPAVMQWASAIAGAAAAKAVGGDAQTGGSTSASDTKNNFLDTEHLLQNPVVAGALLLAGYVVDQQNRILNKEGEVVASWSETVGGWVDSAGTAIEDLYNWAKQSGKEKANDVPSWAKGNKPNPGESGKDFAKRLLDEKYGPGNYDTGPGSEYNKIKKWGDRGFN